MCARTGLWEPRVGNCPGPPGQALTERGESVCTPVCTSEVNSQQADPVAALAAALLGLSAADRARLAAMLIGGQEGQSEG